MSNTGTNDYNAQKLIPAETIVSRTLQAKNRFWTNVIWRSGKPALDSEWNLINDMADETISNLIRSSAPSGWVDLGANKFSSGNSAVANIIQFYSNSKQQVLDIPNAIVNGWPVIVGGVNYTDTSLNSVTLPAPSASASGARFDFVFLEVWRAQVRSRDMNNVPIAQNKPTLTEIYAYGNTQYGGTNFPDDIIDTQIKPIVNGIETSERVQLQYRIRVVPGVTYTNLLSSGFEDAIVQGQGANPVPQVVGYQFTNMKTELNDAGLWRAGAGDQASTVALRSVDGYAYAIPMFKIYRRTTIAYSDSGANALIAYQNQQGNAVALAGLVSDRPDGKFNDGIDATDITDLRLKTCLDKLDLSTIMEQNIDLLFRGQLESTKRQDVQYDSISDTDIYGYTDFKGNEGANGRRVVWSDAATDQSDLFSRLTISTTSNALDVYVVKNSLSPNWDGSGGLKDQIIVQSTIKLPTGTIVKATPRLYVEQTNPFSIDISGTSGSWSGLNTNTATFTFNANLGHNKNIWVYWDISLPVGQGLSNVSKNMLLVKYENSVAFPSGIVVRGDTVHSSPTRYQDVVNHCYQNTTTADGVFEEVISTNPRKQINIAPLVQTTTIRDGAIRSLDTKTTDEINKVVVVPYKIQHLKGIYTSGGTEVATRVVLNTQVSAVYVSANNILVSTNDYIAEMTSLQYDPTGAFVGAQIELLVASAGLYNPVYQHKNITGPTVGTYISLYKPDGTPYTIPLGSAAINFRWSGRKIRARAGVGYGYDINDFTVDCTLSDNNALFTGFSAGQQLWVDMDYLAAPHQGAEVRVVYAYSPYQGLDVGSQNLKLVHRRDSGIFFNNGTGDGTVALTINGTANSSYTPISPRLPGSFNDFLRDGTFINIGSKGTSRFDSDLWMFSAYDVYGYYGGGTIWANDYTMPATPETLSRGFLGDPMLEVIFELPTLDQTYAEFVLPLLVVDKSTNEVYLLVQIGNKGIQKQQEGQVHLELYRLNEKLLLK